MAKSLPDGNIPTIIVGYNIVDRSVFTFKVF